MRTLNEIKAVLQDHKEELRLNYKVSRIGVFGSFARGEQKEKSDIDLLVDFYEPVGWEFIDLIEHLESILDMKVDLTTTPALKRQIRDTVLEELVTV
ncbi:nucleotidyltransferase domain protein [bacterium BMS3Bbin09]|nr:nucleotidyltransferase domain protein [bacterium BMS3Bbin09]